MKNLLVVCGPTATGKTSLAFGLAKKFDGEVVSADSRQVYKGMNIGTGKDIPKGFEFRNSNLEFKGDEVGYYTDGGTRIWGYDLVDPKEDFSVGQYVIVAGNIIEDIWKKKKLPILVGGTGLYIKGVVDGIETAKIPRNEVLRKSLEGKKIGELFEILATLDPVKAGSMNISDRKNQRRLVRAIEIARWKLEVGGAKISHFSPRDHTSHLADLTSILFIGLTAPKRILGRKIEKRVDKRVIQGIEEEIRNLLMQGVGWNNQSMQALGYRQWVQYGPYLLPNAPRLRRVPKSLVRRAGRKSGHTGQALKEKVIKEWEQAEKQYMKRQITWFKRDKRIKWFDISKRNWIKDVEKLVKEWYISSNIKL